MKTRETFRFSQTDASMKIRGLQVWAHMFGTKARRGAVMLSLRPAVRTITVCVKSIDYIHRIDWKVVLIL